MVQFPHWLANLVVIPKQGGKWHVCINFTPLNKVIPKKLYPLPHTDLLADTTAGYNLLSFLHAHKGYHQIQMAKDNEDNTGFVTSEGLFFYKCMSFRLKNTCANFQDMINQMFANQIGKNIEAYIDDILVRTKSS